MDSDISNVHLKPWHVYATGESLHSRAQAGVGGRRGKGQGTGSCWGASLFFYFFLPSLQETGLARWKGLSAVEKEEYKANLLFQAVFFWWLLSLQVARRPRRPEESKRKRSEEGDEQVGNTSKDHLILFTISSFFMSGTEETEVECETEAGLI